MFLVCAMHAGVLILMSACMCDLQAMTDIY